MSVFRLQVLSLCKRQQDVHASHGVLSSETTRSGLAAHFRSDVPALALHDQNVSHALEGTHMALWAWETLLDVGTMQKQKQTSP